MATVLATNTVQRVFLCTLFLVLYSTQVYGVLEDPTSSPTENTPVSIQKVRTIIVDNYYPYTFASSNGEPDGFSVDLMRAATQVMGLELEIRVDTWERALHSLQSGEIDFLPMMAYSKERDKSFDFSAPHTIAYDAFFTGKNSGSIHSLQDLKGKKIIVMKNDQAHDFLISSGVVKDEDLIFIDNLPDGLRRLSAGEGDAALMPKLVGLVLVKKLKLSNLKLSPVVIESYNRPFSFAVNEGNQPLLERFSQGLSILKTTGQYNEIYERWFGPFESSALSVKSVLRYLAGVIILFLFLGVVLLFWTLSLKKQVALRTKSLNDEVEERKKAEKRFRILSDGAFEAVVIHRDGCIIQANAQYYKMFGYEPQELENINAIDKTTAPKSIDIIKAQVATGGLGPYEMYGLKKDGTTFPVEIRARGMEYNGQAVRMAAIRDLSEQKKAEEERKILESRLQRAEKMEAIGTLAGGVAHDLNNVLSGIVGYPDLILMDLPPDSPIRKAIVTIQESGKKAAAIVQDMLTLARRGVAVSEVVNLNDVVRDYQKSPEYEKMKEFFPEARFEVDLQKDLLDILGSPFHLYKTVMNLVSNAMESLTGEGVVTVSTKSQYIDAPIGEYDEVREGDYVVLAVSDNGVGISTEDLQKIFEPFYTKKVMGRSGTGLGMAVVWGTVKDHSGYIDVESIRGEGSTFTLYFPVTRRVGNRKEERAIGDYRGNGESILVVDDSAQQRDIASVLLEKLGYDVDTVASGEEAIDYLKTACPDLVVLDMIMDPGMDGLDTYKKILEICPGQPAIIASGYAETERVREAQKLGAGQYVKKPYTMEKIGMAVGMELRRKTV